MNMNAENCASMLAQIKKMIIHKNNGIIKKKFQKGELYMRRYVMFA